MAYLQPNFSEKQILPGRKIWVTSERVRMSKMFSNGFVTFFFSESHEQNVSSFTIFSYLYYKNSVKIACYFYVKKLTYNNW